MFGVALDAKFAGADATDDHRRAGGAAADRHPRPVRHQALPGLGRRRCPR